MKILIINSLDKRYGSTYRIRKLKDALRSNAFQVIYAESNFEAGKDEISIKQSDSFLGYFIGTLKRLWLSIKTDYEVLIVQKFIPLTLPCILLAKIRGKKIIVDWDDLDAYLQTNLIRKILTSFCERLGPKLPDLITTHSFNISEMARSKTKKPVVVINQGVDFFLFDPSMISGKGVKEKMGIQGKKILGYLCTLTQGGAADLDLVLRVFSDIAKTDGDVRLLIIGGGPKQNDVKNEISKLGLSDKVVITGLLDQAEVPKHLALLDLSLIYMRDNPGNRARVSFKVLESLAMNKLVLGHIVGETAQRFGKYVIETGENLKDFERVILQFLKEKEFSSVREELVKDYSWDNISKRYVEEIRKVLD